MNFDVRIQNSKKVCLGSYLSHHCVKTKGSKNCKTVQWQMILKPYLWLVPIFKFFLHSTVHEKNKNRGKATSLNCTFPEFRALYKMIKTVAFKRHRQILPR